MGWVRRIMLWVGVLLIVAIAAAYMLPRHVRVERSAAIAAPRATVFTVLNSFALFNKWSPWFELDPEAKYAHEGPGAGVGAKLSWVGNPQTLGSGSQIITASEPYEMVAANVDFGQGGSPAKQVYALSANGTGTNITWSIDVDLGMNPVSRYFGLGFDGMIGKDFDKGLALLKKFAEGLPRADFAGLQIETVSVEPKTIAFLPTESPRNDGALAVAIAKAYRELGVFMAVRKVKQSGAPLMIDTGSDASRYVFEAAAPLDRTPDEPVPADSRVQVKQSYGGKALKVALRGPYRGIPEAREKIAAYLAAHGIERNGDSWNEFANDPTTVKESDVLTNIYFPIK
jgi:effector-binding domain-containing protein